MPSTVNGLLVFLFALIPGVPGETIYSSVTGLNWRENQLRRVIRTIIFSLSGVMIYVFTDDFLNWMRWGDLIDPIYIMPSRLDGVGREVVSGIALAYLGHMMCSTTAGVAVAIIWDRTANVIASTTYPTAWADLIDDQAAGRWIVVTLYNDQHYAGIIETADTDVPSEDRDILLKEPALYDDKKEGYVVVRHQYLYLPADIIKSVGVIYDKERMEDEVDRITEVGDIILKTVD